jgi:diguanylate cyclase (GGDEF)-like protein/PAS domain S-box-containing protein
MIKTSQCIVKCPPEQLDVEKWQRLVNMMANLYQAASGVIVQFRQEVFNVVATSENPDNFLHINSNWPWDIKSFCRRIMETNSMLYVKDAKASEEWSCAPPVSEGPVRSYLGYPLFWPDGSLFGSFCIIDTKATDYPKPLIEMLGQLKLIVESELKNLVDTQKIKALLADKINIQQLFEQEQTQIELIKNALSLQELINTATLASLADTVIRIDSHNCILSSNLATESMFGYTRQELLGQDVKILTDLDNNLLNHLKNKRAKTSDKSKQISAKRKDGSIFPVQLSISEIQVGKETQFIGLMADISEKVQHQELLKQLALFDPLTNCANRNLLNERFEYELAKAKREHSSFTIAYLDLNNFKPVNDTHGHTAGDTVLIAVAKRIIETVRAEDLVARIGGDEFVVIFNNQIKFTPMKAKLNTNINQPIIHDELSLLITASIGMSSFPQDGETMKALLNKADSDMYADKSQGDLVIKC